MSGWMNMYWMMSAFQPLDQVFYNIHDLEELLMVDCLYYLVLSLSLFNNQELDSF